MIPSDPQHDGVVLLHGIMRTSRSMNAIRKQLEKQGYHVLNLDYPSTRQSIGDIVDFLHHTIPAFAQTCRQVHFVGYSMGGLIIRAYLARFRPANLGRVVMIGTPNGGSEVANVVQRWWLYKTLYGPAGQQLITDQTAFAALFAPVDYPLGVIAGNLSVEPISSWIIGKPNDGKVSVASTRIDGMLDHIVIPVIHTLLPTSKKSILYTSRFLQHGSFNP